MRAARYCCWTMWPAILAFPLVAWCHRIDDAMASAVQQQRPLFVLGSSPSCEPCRRLHATIDSDATIQRLLRHCEVVLLDAHSHEFAMFAARFPVDARMIPMIYVVMPDGSLLYGQSGLLERQHLAMLLGEAVRRSRPPATPPSAEPSSSLADEQIMASAREHAKQGKLIPALKMVAPLAGRKHPTLQVAYAREYQRRLIEAVQQWLQDLDFQLSTGDSIYGAAYRVAEIHIELPEYRQIREKTDEMLRRYQAQTRTAMAVRQAKVLLRAHYFEAHQSPARALVEFERVVALDPSSPAADFARERMAAVRPVVRNLTDPPRVNRQADLPKPLELRLSIRR